METQHMDCRASQLSLANYLCMLRQCDSGKVIQEISFANWGLPEGVCGSYKPGKVGRGTAANDCIALGRGGVCARVRACAHVVRS